MTQESSLATAEVPVLDTPRVWRVRFNSSGNERIRVLKRGERLVLGSGEAADVILDDATVSSLHCELHATSSGLQVVDLGSKNGLFVGTGRVTRALLIGPRVGFSIGCTSVEAEERDGPRDTRDLGFVGDSVAMRRVRATVLRFAPLRAPVLIVGESGTGKDLVARALHTESGREGSYLPLNVAALTDSLLDAELFGHRRGAFTGAVTDRIGLFEQASGGTLFLDEVADMSASGQAKLLRVVEDGRVRAVGESRERRVSVRLVSATCAPIRERISEGTFRNDLYHRLSHLVIDLPPLRKRADDIPLLAEHYLAKIADDVGHKRLVPASVELLKRAPWPGNIRELFGVLYRAAALATGEELSPGHIQLDGTLKEVRPRLGAARAQELLDIYGSASAAARAAGVPRSTFRSVLERHRSKMAK